MRASSFDDNKADPVTREGDFILWAKKGGGWKETLLQLLLLLLCLIGQISSLGERERE